MQKSGAKEMVLLYNIKGKPYTPHLKTILLTLGIRIKIVSEEEYSTQIGQLIGIAENPSAQPPAVEASKTIEDEMIILHNFTEPRLNQFLAELRRAGITSPLKAIITPHNCSWTSYELHAELSEERETFRKMQQQKEASQE